MSLQEQKLDEFAVDKIGINRGSAMTATETCGKEGNAPTCCKVLGDDRDSFGDGCDGPCTKGN